MPIRCRFPAVRLPYRRARLQVETLEDRTVPSWTPLGPTQMLEGGTENIPGSNPVAGAIHAVAAHPTNPDILYIGAVNGGVWRTTNATAADPNDIVWQPLTDFQSSLSISSIEFDSTDPTFRTLLVGIGHSSGFGRTGGDLTGLLRTTDGGVTWTPLGTSTFAGATIAGAIQRGNNIVVAVSEGTTSQTGLWRSTDGGATFSRRSGPGQFPINSTSGALDLVYDPVSACYYASIQGLGIYRSSNNGQLWANISSSSVRINQTIGTTANNNTELAVGNDGRLYVAILQDNQVKFIGYTTNPTAIFGSSVTWTEMDLPVTLEAANPIGSVTGLAQNPNAIRVTAPNHPLRNGDRVRIADVEGNTAANGDWQVNRIDNDVFELIGSGPADGDYVASTGTWARFAQPSTTPVTGRQGGIHFSIVVDPNNPNIVYIGGDRQNLLPNSLGADIASGRLFRGNTTVAAVAPGSLDNEFSPQWDHLTHTIDMGFLGGGTTSDSAPHAGSRHMVFDAAGNLIEVDDGGIYRRTNPQSQNGDWFSLLGNLQIAEVHDVAYDSLSNVVLVGTQDHADAYQPTQGALVWQILGNGTSSGGDVAVDNLTLAGSNQSIRYTSGANFASFRRTVWNADGTMAGETFPALAVSGMTPSIQGQSRTPLVLNAIDPQRMIIGAANGVYETLDAGATVIRISNQTINTSGPIAYGGNVAVGRLYFGSGNALYVRTQDGAAVQQANTYPGGAIRDLVINPSNEQQVFVADAAGVYFSTDGAATWSNVTRNLNPLENAIQALETVAIDGVDYLVAAGTHGVFAIDTATLLSPAATWVRFGGGGLPNVPVYDLDFDAADRVLVAGTLGRGAWAYYIDAPDLSAVETAALAYTEGDAPTPITGTLVVVSPAGNLVSATVAITGNHLPTEDVLAFTDQLGLTGSFNPATGVLTLTGTASAADYQAALRTVTYANTSDAPNTHPRVVSYRVFSAAFPSNPVTRTITNTPVNDAPDIGLGQEASYFVGTPPILLDPNAVLIDPDSPDFNSGTLGVSLTTNGTADDRLGIRNQGSAPGQIGVVSNQIRFGGVTFATFTGGGATPLAFTFNGNATLAAVQGLLRNLIFSNVSGTPSTLDRTVRLVLADGDGGISPDRTITVRILTSTPLFLNEVLFDPPGTAAPHQAVELRGPGNLVVPAGIYLVAIQGDASGNRGDVQAIFNLSGLTLGTNGFLVLLQNGNTYVTHPDAAVLTSNAAGFSGLSFFSADGGLGDLDTGSVTFQLILTSTPPTLGDDLDADDDGTPESGGVFGNWVVLDAVGVLDGGVGDATYGLTFANGTNGTATGTRQIVTFLPGYVGRRGDTTGATAADWIAAVASGTAPNFTLTPGSTEPAAFGTKNLDHLGTTNFRNAAPMNTVPGAQNILEGQTRTFSAGNGNLVSVSDADAGTGPLRLDITVTGGTLQLFQTTNLTVTGDGTASLSVTGQVADLNAALNGMIYRPTNPDFFGPATIRLLTSDQGNTGVGGTLTDDDTIAITVAPVNDEPNFTLSAGTVTVDEDAGLVTRSAFAQNITRGAANESGQVLTFTLTGTGTTGSLTFAQAPAIDPATGNLTFRTGADTFGTATFDVVLKDDGGTADGGDDTSPTRTFTLVVRSVGELPSVTGAATLEDNQTVSGLVVTPNPLDGPEITHFFIGAIRGGSLFQNNGTTPIAPNSFLTVAQGGAGLKFTPGTHVNAANTAAIGFDVRAATAGDGTGTLGPIAAALVQVTPVNDPPAFDLTTAAVTVDQNAGGQTFPDVAANITRGGGTDEAGQTLTFQVTTTVTAGDLTFTSLPAIDAAGTLRFTPTAFTSGTATVQVVLMDNGGTADGGGNTSATRSFTLTVLFNPAPVPSIQNAPGTIPEGTPVNLSAAITDIAGDTHTYLWVAHRNGQPVAATTTPTFSFVPADEGEYSVGLTVTDSIGKQGSDVRTFTVVNVLSSLNVAFSTTLTSDANGNGRLDPGDGFAGSIVVTNAGPSIASSVTLQPLFDAPVRIIPGTVRTFPGGNLLNPAAPQFAVFRNGALFIDRNGDGSYGAGDSTHFYGQAGDRPVVGDWNGDGVEEIGIYRNGLWVLDATGDLAYGPGDRSTSFGGIPYLPTSQGFVGDLPVVGDWNGDGKDDIGVFRNGLWILDLNGDGVYGPGDGTFSFGTIADLPVVGDWDGNGTDDFGIFRNGLWILDRNGDRSYGPGDVAFGFGGFGDLPVVGDWNGNGTDDLGIFRNGLLVQDRSGDGSYGPGDTAFFYGQAGDVPLAGLWLPSSFQPPPSDLLGNLAPGQSARYEFKGLIASGTTQGIDVVMRALVDGIDAGTGLPFGPTVGSVRRTLGAVVAPPSGTLQVIPSVQSQQAGLAVLLLDFANPGAAAGQAFLQIDVPAGTTVNTGSGSLGWVQVGVGRFRLTVGPLAAGQGGRALLHLTFNPLSPPSLPGDLTIAIGKDF